jgi:hypothetical protein
VQLAYGFEARTQHQLSSSWLEEQEDRLHATDLHDNSLESIKARYRKTQAGGSNANTKAEVVTHSIGKRIRLQRSKSWVGRLLVTPANEVATWNRSRRNRGPSA